MNLTKYLEAGKEYGIEPYQVSYSTQTEMTVSLFNGVVDNQTIGVSNDIGARGIVDGKQGSFSTDAFDKDTPMLLAKEVKESAKYGREVDKDTFFDGNAKYKKAKVFLPGFKESNLSELRQLGERITQEANSLDKRVSKVQVDITMVQEEDLKVNSLGLKIKEKRRLYSACIQVVCLDEKDQEPRSGDAVFTSFLGLTELEAKSHKAIKEAVKDAVDFFHSAPVPTAKYKVLLTPASFSSLLSFYVGQLNAKSVHKNLSLFVGKKDTRIASKALTIKNTPHVTSPSATSYDGDGVPTKDFTILDRGVLKNYFYSRETAKEDKTESNGCACGNGNGMPQVMTVQKGRLNRQELIQKMNNGLILTSINGLNSGIDGQTLNFSLPCSGYVVEDGKITKATSMILCAGNLKDLFDSIVTIGNDVEEKGGIFTPSVLVKKIAISGK